MILTVRTHKPEAEVGIVKVGKEIAYIKWKAHRELESTLLLKIEEVLKQAGIELGDLRGTVVFAGPGSFTGLRIGFAVVNTLASQLHISNVATGGDNWIDEGINRLKNTQNPSILIPDYGGTANITLPRK